MMSESSASKMPNMGMNCGGLALRMNWTTGGNTLRKSKQTAHETDSAFVVAARCLGGEN